MWGAIEQLGVERIGHGVRSVEYPALIDYLVDRGTPLEVCPTSNIRTGVAADWDDHPVHELMDAGVNVTINSDDPSFFNCSLAEEFRKLSQYEGKSMEDLTLSAVEASWLNGEDRRELAARVQKWWAAQSTSG